MEITDLCFKFIKKHNDYEYHYAKYGEFIVVMIKSNDYTNGYINATKLCQYGNKLYKNWLQLESSKDLINEISLAGIPAAENNDIFFKFMGGKGKEYDIIRGTYVNDKLILSISLWLSSKFYLHVSDIIKNYFVNNFKNEIKLNKNKLDDLNIEVDKYNKIIEEKNNCITSLENSIQELNISNNKLNNTLQDIKPKIINTPISLDKYSTFAVFKINNNDANDKKYYITTVCERDFDKRYNNLSIEYINIRLKLKLENIPNAKYLFDKIKNELENEIEWNRNIVELKNISEATLLRIIQEIREEIDL
ncbi:KilA-N domain-containing protein [Alphaentomopoxvirus acuprea]|uniref:KilA-N domain-containing protein n=1 Tax=Alphaentomopoxvirus acuprea TaxID=62099 RepID=W6JIM4_9POXV|nr:KilA-N domain-containing protein [Anomala cuprea entomopoxvirus]BAO49423.1 KilA-N domain-containing protein [Anomala cuprea entomopoxvirus]